MKTYLLMAVICLAAPVLALKDAIAVSTDSRHCYSLIDADTRASCLAEALRQPWRCDGIPDPDMRALCKMRAQ